MPEDYKTEVALLKRDAETLEKRLAKLESLVNWGAIAIIGTVITQVMRATGISQ